MPRSHGTGVILALLPFFVSAQQSPTPGLANQIGEQEADRSWLRVTGQMDIEAVLMRPHVGENSRGIGVAEAVVDVAADFSQGISAELQFLAEDTDIGAPENLPGAEDFRLEVATLTYTPATAPCYATAGRDFLPFGRFHTNLVSDPLTLELGETIEFSWNVGYSWNGWSFSAFGFNGDDDGKGGLAGYGAAFGYSNEGERTGIELNLAYTSDLGYSENLLAHLATTGAQWEATPGWTASAMLRTGRASLILEYLGSLEHFEPQVIDFAGRGARPTSWMVEAAYGFTLSGRDATAAVGYQVTGQSLALQLPKRRWLAVLRVHLADPVAVAIELARDRDYAERVGGSGADVTLVTAQFSLFF